MADIHLLLQKQKELEGDLFQEQLDNEIGTAIERTLLGRQALIENDFNEQLQAKMNNWSSILNSTQPKDYASLARIQGERDVSELTPMLNDIQNVNKRNALKVKLENQQTKYYTQAFEKDRKVTMNAVSNKLKEKKAIFGNALATGNMEFIQTEANRYMEFADDLYSKGLLSGSEYQELRGKVASDLENTGTKEAFVNSKTVEFASGPANALVALTKEFAQLKKNGISQENELKLLEEMNSLKKEVLKDQEKKKKDRDLTLKGIYGTAYEDTKTIGETVTDDFYKGKGDLRTVLSNIQDQNNTIKKLIPVTKGKVEKVKLLKERSKLENKAKFVMGVARSASDMTKLLKGEKVDFGIKNDADLIELTQDFYKSFGLSPGEEFGSAQASQIADFFLSQNKTSDAKSMAKFGSTQGSQPTPIENMADHLFGKEPNENKQSYVQGMTSLAVQKAAGVRESELTEQQSEEFIDIANGFLAEGRQGLPKLQVFLNNMAAFGNDKVIDVFADSLGVDKQAMANTLQGLVNMNPSSKSFEDAFKGLALLTGENNEDAQAMFNTIYGSVKDIKKIDKFADIISPKDRSLGKRLIALKLLGQSSGSANKTSFSSTEEIERVIKNDPDYKRLDAMTYHGDNVTIRKQDDGNAAVLGSKIVDRSFPGFFRERFNIAFDFFNTQEKIYNNVSDAIVAVFDYTGADNRGQTHRLGWGEYVDNISFNENQMYFMRKEFAGDKQKNKVFVRDKQGNKHYVKFDFRGFGRMLQREKRAFMVGAEGIGHLSFANIKSNELPFERVLEFFNLPKYIKDDILAQKDNLADRDRDVRNPFFGGRQ